MCKSVLPTLPYLQTSVFSIPFAFLKDYSLLAKTIFVQKRKKQVHAVPLPFNKVFPLSGFMLLVPQNILFCLSSGSSPASLSPSDQAVVYKNKQAGEEWSIFVSHYFKNITELLCKTISILTSTPKTVDVLQISYHNSFQSHNYG